MNSVETEEIFSLVNVLYSFVLYSYIGSEKHVLHSNWTASVYGCFMNALIDQTQSVSK